MALRLVYILSSITFILLSSVGRSYSLEVSDEPFCFIVFSDGVLRDLTGICQGNRSSTSSVQVPSNSQLDEASRLYNRVYCYSLAQGSSRAISIEDANLAASIHLNMKGVNESSFQPEFNASSIGMDSC